MGRNGTVLVIAAFCCQGLQAQFNGPESVEYDPVADHYYVSNTQSSSIKVLAQNGTVTDLVTGMSNSPYGLELMQGVLYACTGDGVRGYSPETGEELYYRDLNAGFPNGITTDGAFLYITDFSAQRIYKVDPVNDSHTTLVAATAGTPNGIVYDPAADRLVVVFWGSNAPIKAFDPTTGEATVLVANTSLGNIDGVTIDCAGYFITASWSPARLTRWEPTFTQPGVNMNAVGLQNPADIDFDPVNDRVAIPNSSGNTVTFHDVDCSTGVPHQPEEPLIVLPNPVQDLVHVQPPFKKGEPYIILDGRGLLIGGGTLSPNAMIDLRQLAAGVYVLHFTAAGRQVKLIKE